MQTRAAAEDENIRRRYLELRYDGDRKISGVAMPYGDVAELPWGEKERFEPGAFGDLAGADVILNVQHQREMSVARTGGAGLMLDDSDTALRISAELLETTDGEDALAKVRAKVLRGLSIEFIPEKYRWEGDDRDTIVIEKAELRNIAIVDRPAYPQAMINARQRDTKAQEADMNEEQIRALIEEMLAKRGEQTGEPLDVSAIVTGVTESVETQVREQVDEAIKARDEAQEAQKRAEDEKVAAEKVATEERAQIEADAEARAELIGQVRELLPKDYDTKGKTVKDILVTSVGDEVADADKRSEDYLLAKVEGILERRDDAQTGLRNSQVDGTTTTTTSTASEAPVNITRLIEQRNAKRSAATN